MKERPILFNAEMVRAILDGRKTQTRRVMKPQPESSRCIFDERAVVKTHYAVAHNGDGVAKTVVGFSWKQHGIKSYPCDAAAFRWLCKFGKPGDRLWVRENYRFSSAHDGLAPCEVPPGDSVEYLAEKEEILTGEIRPSIHMPRWASRITLEITGIRVERLMNISGEDAIAEGVDDRECPTYQTPFQLEHMIRFGSCAYTIDYIGGFKSLWESIFGEGSWDANPWVWVIEFRKLEGGAK